MGWMDRHRLPESSGIADLDAPASAMAHRRIIRNKPWLHRLYSDFYRIFVQAVPDPDGKVLVEVGSGGGFLKEMVQPVITSDILELAGVDCVFGGEKMPFASCSVDAFFLFDALHHMADPAAFLAEARRCLTPGGRVVMIEPANTPWSRLIYRHLHHEPFNSSAGWRIPGEGPLSRANGALPWIIFVRDRVMFQSQFKALEISRLVLHTPFCYLLSGGLSYKCVFPIWIYSSVKALEWLLSPLNRWIGMFMTVELRKKDGGREPAGV